MAAGKIPGTKRTGGKIEYGGIELDTGAHIAHCEGASVHLTAKESALLAAFLAAPGRVYTREALLTLVWQAPCGEGLRTRTVDMHIRQLRRKLGGCHRIETVYKCGYRWAE